MDSSLPLSRRSLLAAVGGIGGGAVLGVVLGTAPARADVTVRADVTALGNTAAPAGPASLVTRRIEGSDASVVLAAGAAEILLHVARRYHYEVEAIGAGDVLGYARDPRFRGEAQAAHRTGTAVCLHEGRHPGGAAQTLFPTQVETVRDILADCEGIVYWGGDDRDFPLEGHFRIAATAAAATVSGVSAKIAAWRDEPGLGAGILVDPSVPERRARAERLARRRG